MAEHRPGWHWTEARSTLGERPAWRHTLSDQSEFIRRETTLCAPPLVPEIRLQLAREIVPIWVATEAFLGTTARAPPFWAFPWAGGQALARYVLDHPELVRGRSVLDFAAGSGLVAIAALQAGARAALGADIDPLAGAAMAQNAQHNGVTLTTTALDLIDAPGEWDVILAGDVCYERPLAERVHRWLRRLAAQGAEVLLGDPGRAYLPQHGLTELARYTVPTSLELEDRTTRATVVWRVEPE